MIEFNATFIVSIVSFVVFIFIMNLIFYKPVLSIIRKREEYIIDNNNEAKDLTRRTNEALQEIESAVSQEKALCSKNAAMTIEKLRQNAQDRINTNRIAANKKISDAKSLIYEEEAAIADKIDREQVEGLSDFLYEEIIKGKL